jgi:tRNA(His) guanylyltransferase
MEIRTDKDPLGTRIKENYENRTRYYLPRRTYTILRLDGCHFRTYTKGLNKPFDKGLVEDIDSAIIKILPQIQGAVFAYTQSDEISILLTDFATPQTCAWFDGNLQKICSVSASIMTAEFNKYRLWRDDIVKKTCDKAVNFEAFQHAYFDARVFTIPDRTEVMNYFIWRHADCSRNSVSMVAQSLYSHKELQGKSTKDMHEMIHAKGVKWATDFSDGEKNGRIFVKEIEEVSLKEFNKDRPDEFKIYEFGSNMPGHDTIKRSRWVSQDAWRFTENKDKLLAMIPEYE